MTDFPTLGLQFDLAQLRQGVVELGRGRVAFEQAGQAASRSTRETKENARASREAGVVADQAGKAQKRASDSASAAQRANQRQIQDTIRQLRVLNDVARALRLEQQLRQRMELIDRVNTAGGGGGGRRGGSGGGGSTPAPNDGDRRSILATVAAWFGLGRAYDVVSAKGGGLFKNLGQLRVALLNARFAAALLIGALTLGPLAAFADQMVSLEARTKLYAQRASDVPSIMEDVYRTAQRARQPLAGVATLYTRLAPLAQQLGRSQTDMLRVTETVAKAFTLGGAAASEATASAQQFAQALSSNRFGGDELRSVAENAPVLLQAIAEGVNQINPALNLNAATFIKWAQAGNANSAVMVQAIENARAKIDAMFRTMPVTIGQGISVLGNAVQYAVGQIDILAGAGGQRLSTEIASWIAAFARFVESKAFIDTVVGALKALRAVIEVVGGLIGFLADNFKTLAVAIATVFIVAKLIPLFEALALSIRVYGVATTVAVNATAAATVATTALKAAWVALVAATPLIVIVAVTSALMFMSDALAKGDAAFKNMQKAGEDTYAALERAKTLVGAYGGETKALTDAMLEAAGVERERTEAMTEGEKAAQARAEMDKAMALAALAAAKADLVSMEANAQRGQAFNRFVNDVMSGLAAVDRFFGNDATADVADRMAARARERISQQITAAQEAKRLMGTITAAEGVVRATDFTATSPAAGSGVVNMGGEDDAAKKTRGLESAVKRIADLRAEMTKLQREVDATRVGFFGPGGLDQLEAEAAALDVLAKYGVQSIDAIADARMREAAATESQLAASVALKRIENERITGLITERRETERQAYAIQQAAGYAADASQDMIDYYSGSAMGAEALARALSNQADRQLDAKIAAEAFSIANQFGVRTTGELTGALKEEAQALLDARVANLRLTDAEERASAARAAREDRQKEIKDLRDYIAAVDGSTRALADFQRQASITAAVGAAGPGVDVREVANDVDTIANLRIRETITKGILAISMEEIEVRAGAALREAGHAQLIFDYMKANKDITEEQARIAIEGATRELALRQQIAKVTASVQDSIRNAFVQTGALDFSSLGNAIAQSARKAIYDNLLAKPIDIMVNAVVNVVTRGIEALVRKIAEASGAEKGADPMSFLADKFSGGMEKLGERVGSLINKIPAGIKMAMGNIIQGMAMGGAAADILGLEGSGSKWQVVGDMLGATAGTIIGTMIGGPIGGLIGSTIGTIASRLVGTLFGDKGRALAVTALEVQNGQFVSKGTQAYDGGPRDEIDKAGKDLAKLLNQMAKAFDLDLTKANGLYTTFGWTAGENTKALGGEGFFGGQLRGIADLRGMSLDQIKGSALGRGVDLSQVKDAEQAIDRILRETLIRIGDAVDDPFTEAEKALIRAAESLEEAAQQLYAARNVENNLQRQLLKFTDPKAFEMANLRDSQLARRREIMNMVDQGLISEDRRGGIEELLQQLEGAETADALQRLADGANGAAASLKDIQRAQARIAEYTRGLLVGKLSPLSPQAQLDAAANEFARTLLLAQGGDIDALDRITNVANDYLSAAQQFYGSSTDYAAIFGQVTAALNELATRDFQDPLISALEEQMELLRQAIDDATLRLIEALDDDDTDTGAGGGGTGGGLTGGGGGGTDGDTRRPVDDEIIDTLDRGFMGLEDRLADLAQAIVQSNDNSARTIVDGVTQTTERRVATAGGKA